MAPAICLGDSDCALTDAMENSSCPDPDPVADEALLFRGMVRFKGAVFALRYLQLFPDILGDPLPHQGLIGNPLLRGDFFDRQEIERVKLDRDVLQFSLSFSREDVLLERVLKTQRDFTFHDFTENASFIVVLRISHFFLC